MRLLFALLLIGQAWVWGAAPENTLTITDTSSSIQTDRPTRFGRPFAAGEIWNYPQPIVDSTPATSWQSTVKNRHRDGSSSCTVTDATNEYPITVTCADHGYRNGEYVVISGVTGNTAANGRHRIIRRGRHTFFLQGATGNGVYSAGGTVTGPGLGSVRFAIIVLDDDIDLSADGSVTVTFQDSVNACHLGDEATCEAAALTEAEMLAWDSSGWGAEIEAVQGNTYTADARVMVDAADFEYWIAGPILTEVIVRDHEIGRAYDFGWSCSTDIGDACAGGSWSTDATNKSLSPVFVLGFYDALQSSVRIEYILENMWYGHLQDQEYALTLNSDSTGSTEEYPKAEFVHYAKTRWRKVFWDGVEPAAINIDHDEAYTEYTGAINVWADDVEPGAADITYNTGSSQCSSTAVFDINDNGCYEKIFDTGGARPELGIFSTWEAVWLQTFADGIWDQVWNSGNVSGHIPIHFREASTDTTLYFIDVDADGSTDNDTDDNVAGNGVHGRIFSIDARPFETSVGGGTVATLSSSHGWSPDWAHQAAFGFTPYLFTGEWYFLEEMQFWAVWSMTYFNASYGTGHRGHTWGLLSPDLQTRGVGWAGRNILQSAWASPDGSVEKEYLTNKAEFNIMSLSGKFADHRRDANYLPLIGNTDADPCNGFIWDQNMWEQENPYCYGYYFYNGLGGHTQNPMGVPMYHSATGWCDEWSTGTSTVCDSTWMQDYLISGYYGRGKDLGYETDTLLHMSARYRLMYLNDQHNPYLTFKFRVPILSPVTSTFPKSIEEHFLMWNSTGQNTAAFQDNNIYIVLGYAYSWVHGTLPYLIGGRSGTVEWRDAWDWYTNPANVPNMDVRCTAGTQAGGCTTSLMEPRFNLGPRFPPTSNADVTPGDDYSIWRYTAPAADSTCTIDGNDDGQTGRPREYVLTGLAASTGYNHILSCPDDPWGSETVSYTTTAAPTGTADLSVRLGSGDSTSYLDWGYTISMTETPVSAACSSGCELTISGATKGLVYYQVRHADGRTGAITQTNLQ